MGRMKEMYEVTKHMSCAAFEMGEAIEKLCDIGMSEPDTKCKGMTITGDASFNGHVDCDNVTIGGALSLEGDDDQDLSLGGHNDAEDAFNSGAFGVKEAVTMEAIAAVRKLVKHAPPESIEMFDGMLNALEQLVKGSE